MDILRRSINDTKNLLFYPKITYTNYANNLENHLLLSGSAVPSLAEVVNNEKDLIKLRFGTGQVYRIPVIYPDGRLVPADGEIYPSDRTHAVWGIPSIRLACRRINFHITKGISYVNANPGRSCARRTC
jgi:hypothetical protein